MNNLMNYKYLLKTENETIQKSENEIQIWYENYEVFMDSLFQFIYYVGETNDPNSDEGMFFAFAHLHFLKIPYTLRATALLLERGYYAESAQLVRNLFEVIVQLRYFQLNKNLLNDYVLKIKKITNRTMIGHFNDNLYTTVYSALSTISHSEIGSTIFRTYYKSSSEGRTIMGCQFNSRFYHFIMNILEAIIFGLLNFIPSFFDQYLQNVPESIEDQRIKCLNEISIILNAEPKSLEFLDNIALLIGLNQEQQ